MNEVLHICPYCKSKQIVQFRLDSDWAPCAGDWNRINDESDYENWQNKQIDNNERQDIETCFCYVCCRCFDEPIDQIKEKAREGK